jgi:uncharacterized protein (TIGR04255 family)
VEPADFQEMIRDEFPQYVRRNETPPPKIIGFGSPNARLEQSTPITNYHFLSADGLWKLNLTRDFISLSTLRYPGWEEFARHLDRPLASFIQLYKPAYFQRVGLRYMNVFSRKQLGLEDTAWSDLFSPAYLGAFSEPDVNPDTVINTRMETLLKLDSSCQAKIQAGPGLVKNNKPGAVQDPEQKFILDLDLAMTGNTPCTLAAAGLETLHGHSTRIFEGAITDCLRNAMQLL